MEVTTPSQYEERSKKRQKRAGRPCDACRRRKTRCIPGADDDQCCLHCQLKQTSCTFRLDPPRRQPITQGAVIGSPVPPSTDTGLVQQLGIPNGPSPTTAIPAVSRGHGNNPQSDISLGQNALGHVPPANASLGLAPSRFAELYGLGSDMEPILMKYRPYDSSTHEFCLETHAIRRVLDKDDGQEYPLTFHVAADEKALDADVDLSQVTAIENCVTPNGPTLLDLFWRHVQPCYPILSKDVFMQVYRRSFKCVPAALLGAIYLSALRWWGYDAELSLYPPPNAATLRKLIYKSLPICYHRPKLSSIQATLLLLQCQPEDPLNPGHTFQWGLTCQALAIGQCLGLHLDASSWSIPPWERNVRKRLSWALYMQDRWTALAYGRPVHIHDDDWTTEDLTDADFADNEDPPPLNQGDKQRSFVFTGMLQYIHMVQLTKILSSALSTFYTARASRGQDTILLYQRAQPLFEALRQWSNTIPPELQMGITYQRKLCFHGYLHFSYFGVMITLLRRLIRSTILPPRCVDDQVLADIRQLALQTAQGAISFVTNLRPDHLEAFWYFTSPYLFSLLGSFTTLLLVTSLSSQERSFWQETLNSYLWTLRVMSKSSGPMQYAVNRLEGAILRGLEHSLAVNLNEPIDDNVGPDLASFHTAQTYEFTDFGDWDLAADGAYDLLSGMILSPEGLTMRGDAIEGRDIVN